MTKKKKEENREQAPDSAQNDAAINADVVAALQGALEESRRQADEYKEGWQRMQADFTNYKRRVERDQATNQQNAAANVLRRYLEVADDLERALGKRPTEGEAGLWADGIDLTFRKLMNYLEAEGVTPIQAEGEFFDPTLHEAIMQEDSAEHESGQIIGVVQQGYRLGERVLRPARVRVAR